MQNIIDALKNTQNPDNNIRKQAENQLLQFCKVSGFTGTLFKLVVSANIDLSIRQAGAIYLKNFIKFQIDHKCFDQNEKAFIKQNIVQGIIHSHPAIKKQLCMCFMNIVELDFHTNQWKELIPSILKYLSSNEIGTIHGALICLRCVFKSFEFSKLDELRPHISAITTQTFPLLTKLFHYLLTQNSPQFAELRYLATKIFWEAVNYGLSDYFIKNRDNLKIWMTMIAQLLKLSVPQDAKYTSPYWKSKKWACHIVYRLLSSYISSDYSDDEEHKSFAKYFLETYLIEFMKIFIGILEAARKGAYVPSRIIALSIYYLDTSLNYKKSYELLVSQFEYLLSELLFPHVCYGEEDIILWKEDPQEYLRKSYDILEDLYSPKIAVANVLLDLIKGRTKELMPKYLNFINRVLTSYQNREKNFAMKDGVLYTIGVLRSVLFKKKQYKKLLEPLFVTHIIPELGNKSCGFLRSKACWLIGSYALIQWSKQENFIAALHGVLNCMKDTELPVKIHAAVALSNMLGNEICLKEIRPILPQLLDAYLKIMNEMDNDKLVTSLEILIDSFADEMEPYAVELCNKMAQAFLRIFNTEEEETSEVALNCLCAIITLLSSVSKKPHLYPEIEIKILPAIVKTVSYEGFEFLQEGIEIVTYITYYSKTISKNMWVVFDMLYKACNEWAIEYISHVVAPFDNMISKDTQTFLQGDRLNKVFSLCKRILGDEKTAEKDCQSATKLLSIMLQNCRGKIDQCVFAFLELVVKRLSIARSDALKILLLDTVADALIYNPQLTILSLEKLGCTQNVFQMWLKTLPSYKRVYDKRITCLGLTSLFTQDITKLPMRSLLPQLFSATINLLVNVHEQKQEEQKKRAEWEKEKEEIKEKLLSENDEEDDEVFDQFEIKEILNEISHYKTVHDEDYDEEDDLEDPDETFYTPLDNINENTFFGETAYKMSKMFGDAFNQLTQNLNQKEKAALQQLINNSLKK